MHSITSDGPYAMNECNSCYIKKEIKAGIAEHELFEARTNSHKHKLEIDALQAAIASLDEVRSSIERQIRKFKGE